MVRAPPLSLASDPPSATAPRMKRVTIYLPNLHGGGAERIMVSVANGLAALGHRVDLVLASAVGTYLAEVDDAVRVVDLGQRRVVTSLPALVRYLRTESPDAVLSAINHSNITALLARKLAGARCRVVVSERNAPSRSLSGGRTAAIMRVLTQRLYPSADAIVCVSRGVQREMEELLGLPSDKLSTIYNPLDVDRIASSMAEPTGHEWLDRKTMPVVVAVGRLTAQKDYPTLLRAFAALRRCRPARLIVVGEGDDRTRLEALATELSVGAEVAFVGFQRNPFAWMAASDLYVLSSAWEGLPGALLQAMACGARIVSTDCRTGPDEILEDGRWGRLVPVGDYLAMATAMNAALDDASPPDVRKRADAFRPEHAISAYAQVLGL